MENHEEQWVQAPTVTYRGFFNEGHAEVVVTVEGENASMSPLESVRPGWAFFWGGKGHTPGEAILAQSILKHALGSHTDAVTLHQRFKYRTVALWTQGLDWSISKREVLAIVESIRTVERETQQSRVMVMQQPMPVVNEGGGGIARSQQDQGPGPRVEQPVDPAARQAREAALAKLTDEERRALGL